MNYSGEKSVTEVIEELCLRLDVIVERVNACNDDIILDNPYGLGMYIGLIDSFIMEDLTEVLEKYPLLKKDYLNNSAYKMRIQLCTSTNQYSSARFNKEKRILSIMCPKF